MSQNNTNNTFWSKDPLVILDTKNLYEFFPTEKMTLNEKLNAIVRLSLYTSILMGLYTKSMNALKYLILGLIVTYIIYIGQESKKNEQDNKETKLNNTNANTTFLPVTAQTPVPGAAPVIEKLENICQKPTAENPFMNATYVDWLENPDRPEACNINDPDVKKEADDIFNNGLYRDVSDNMGKINAQRQFFTMPYTTFPNKQDTFAKWLYYTEDNCKQNPDRCLQYEDLRGKRFILPNAYENPVSTKKDE